MISDESPHENEPRGNIEQDEPQVEPAAASQQGAQAHIVLRKHYVCPYLGLRDDRTVLAMVPTPAHACFARRRRYSPSIEHQIVRCLSSNYPGCSIYPDKTGTKAAHDKLFTLQGDVSTDRRDGLKWLRWAVPALLILALLGASSYAFAQGLLALPQLPLATQAVSTGGGTIPSLTGEQEVIDAVTPTSLAVTPTPDLPTQQAIAQAIIPTVAATPILSGETTTTEQGETLSITPLRVDVGWWASAQTQPGIADSFLYAGVYEQQAYVAAVRFDLRRVPRGARIESGLIRLTGLRDELLDAATNSTWVVQLVSESTLPELPGASFFTIYEAQASFQLTPYIESAAVGIGRVNELALDAAVRSWLFQQRLDGATSVVLRILPLENSGNSLFAWDSGHGAESSGAAPTLILEVGAMPPTPPPTPTRPQVVATLTPTPENVLTVVALTPPAPAQVVPTSTPVPPEIVTPTPIAMDLPAVQTAAVAEGRPPVLLDTPVPANAATATTNAAYATAVALTTGTFTPVPTNYVTPVLYLPPPPPENIATAAARSVEATVAAQSGTPTPTRHPNAVDAIYVYATETPANQEIAAALIVDQNRRAVTTGTPTPTPWNLVVITRVPEPPEPTPTEIPLFIPTSQITPSPTPTPTRLLTSEDLERFRNQILFLSNRNGGQQVWVLDPVTGVTIGTVTDPRIHSTARERFLAFSPDGKEQAIVQPGDNQILQIKIVNFEYGTTRQLTHVAWGIAYDPAWSPRGDQVAFVGTMSNGDEIYTIPLGGDDPLRLTFNTWEWDKHPTWSPDGTQIAFFSNRETGRRQIWVMNADGTNPRNLSNSEFEDWDPVWIR